MTARARYAVLLVLWACAACGDEPAPALDSDGDNLSDADEAKLGTDPNQVDSDLDGVPDYSDDADGDGVSNAEEVAAGTAAPPRGSDGTQPSGAAGAASDQDTTDRSAGTGDVPQGGDAPGDQPADQPSDTPDETPADAPDSDFCAALREKCGAGDSAACEMLKLDDACAQPVDAPSCEELWARCADNQARACEAFVASCELPGCEDLKAACDAGSEPVCAFHERKCTNGWGDGEEPAFCPDLRAACQAGSEDACTLVERDCSGAIDCSALEVQCKEAGGVGEACDLLALHCG